MLVIGHLAAKTRWKKWFASSIWMEETRAHMFEHGAWEHMGARDVHKEQLCPSMKCMLHNQSLYVNVIFICINSAVRMQEHLIMCATDFLHYGALPGSQHHGRAVGL